MRKPKVKNKYNIKPHDIERAIILNPDKLHERPFWRHHVGKAWCLSGGVKLVAPPPNYYTILFYDSDAPKFAGQIRLTIDVWSYKSWCDVVPQEFYNPSDIEDEKYLRLQEKLLSRLNWLIDQNIVSIPGVEVPNEIQQT